MLGVERVGNPRRDRRDRAETTEVRVLGKPRGVDLDLPRRRRERMALGIADLAREGDSVLGRGKPGEAVRAEGVEVVDRAGGELAQPRVLGLVVVARDAEAGGEVRADVEVVATLARRLDRLVHEEDVVAAAVPRRVDVVAGSTMSA